MISVALISMGSCLLGALVLTGWVVLVNLRAMKELRLALFRYVADSAEKGPKDSVLEMSHETPEPTGNLLGQDDNADFDKIMDAGVLARDQEARFLG